MRRALQPGTQSLYGPGSNGQSMNGASNGKQEPYSYINGASRQAEMYEQLSTAFVNGVVNGETVPQFNGNADTNRESTEDTEKQNPLSTNVPRHQSSVTSDIDAQKDTQKILEEKKRAEEEKCALEAETARLREELADSRRKVKDAASDLERELAMAEAELNEARSTKASANALVEESRRAAELHWRGAVDDLERQANFLSNELSSLRRDQEALMNAAAQEKARLEEGLSLVRQQLESQTTLLAKEREKALALELAVKEAEQKCQSAERELSAEKISSAAKIREFEQHIMQQDEEITQLKARLADPRALSSLLLSAILSDFTDSKLATRVQTRFGHVKKASVILLFTALLWPITKVIRPPGA
eukprot:CAMPEP_0197288600 /NCGR_PEP_ID=MMETSP0890-20130614/5744_1 /TAXON_ID=44058 ORGANISM="Aureoumbra lagunensis, Strain CCMP1510" /NCGR_SAMPLE_ID=MMETSP0890 /ASSEMBLY_ACC=CAM_ASM_000533 /LENGTH=361 /DNA_ID=CAMNT_0042759455 /DNA_START=168 /DNA_END=1253 /DNA_ORIENTATION=+